VPRGLLLLPRTNNVAPTNTGAANWEIR
jgi:hypothetical protein